MEKCNISCIKRSGRSVKTLIAWVRVVDKAGAVLVLVLGLGLVLEVEVKVVVESQYVRLR